MREAYSKTKNQSTRFNRYGVYSPELEERARSMRQRFHTAIRDQKRRHWQEFLENTSNIWQAAKYAKDQDTSFQKILPLRNPDDTLEETDAGKAKIFLDSFFPPPPRAQGVQRREPLVPFTLHSFSDDEFQQAVIKMNKWKGPGPDQLPTAVWQELWPAIGSPICNIYRASLRLAYLPYRWREACIIPFHKKGKDRSKANSYRPISLLCTLGKILEAAVANRISYMAETYKLLPENHFGARKRRSCEQALNILVEKIHEAWRQDKVLSLIIIYKLRRQRGIQRSRQRYVTETLRR